MYQSLEHLFYSQTYFAETLKFTSFSMSDVAEISGAIKCILHSAGDWDGGRKERMIKEKLENVPIEREIENGQNSYEDNEDGSNNEEGNNTAETRC